MVKYEYFAGVVDTEKGTTGFPSIAIVKSNEKEGTGYFELNDSFVRNLPSLDSVSLYPKLIFYQRVSFPSPQKPDSLPSLNHRNYQQEVPKTKISLLEETKEPELVKKPPQETTEKEIAEIFSRGRQTDSSNI